jgi:hypothetical protein
VSFEPSQQVSQLALGWVYGLAACLQLYQNMLGIGSAPSFAFALPVLPSFYMLRVDATAARFVSRQ